MLYKLRKRFDEVIYIDLYGLGWNLVLNLSKFPLSTILRLLETNPLPRSTPTLRILEAHAKVKSVDKEAEKSCFTTRSMRSSKPLNLETSKRITWSTRILDKERHTTSFGLSMTN